MKVLLSINPPYVDKIFNGEKKFEYRRAIFKDNSVDTIVIYSTSPIKKVVGEFKVKKIHCDTPEKLWENTYPYTGINKVDFFNYFKDRNLGYALKIGDITKYEIPKTLSEIGVKSAPQSFIYLK